MGEVIAGPWGSRVDYAGNPLEADLTDGEPRPEERPPTAAEYHRRTGERLPPISRNEAIKRIRAGLKKRSGKSWSVTGGRGTAWGWLRIDAPPKARVYGWNGPESHEAHGPSYRAGEGSASAERREELAKLLGRQWIHQQGESIPASSDYYWEYVDRAEGRTPRVVGEPYWD